MKACQISGFEPFLSEALPKRTQGNFISQEISGTSMF